MLWRLRNALNLAPAYIYRNRWHDEQERSAKAISELRALQAFVGPAVMAEFAVVNALKARAR